MHYPVDLSLLQNVSHMPALPVLERSMNRPELHLHDFCIPVNPYFPTPELMADLQERLNHILRFYPSDNQTISEILAGFLELDPQNLVVANGSTELITWINERYITHDLVTDIPTFGRWTDNPEELGHHVHHCLRQRENQFRLSVADLVHSVRESGARALAICNPNNPTGACMQREEVLQLLEELRDLEVIGIDESFIDFVSEESIPTVADAVNDFPNAIVIKSLGKNLGLHGLRCGYAVASKPLAAELRKMLPPWNVNSLAEQFVRSLANHREEYEAGRRQVVRDAKRFAERLSQIPGLTISPTHANFVYCEVDAAIPSTRLRDDLLLNHGCFVRECGSKLGSSSQFFRIATRPDDQQNLLLEALRDCISRLGQNPYLCWMSWRAPVNNSEGPG